MLYGILAVAIGGTAILFAKFVMPNLQAKMEEKGRIEKEKREARKAAKKADK